MNKKKIVLFHFQPLELYPPVMNMIDFISRDSQVDLLVLSQKVDKKYGLLEYNNNIDNVRIIRTAPWSFQKWIRLIQYIQIHIIALYNTIKWNPSSLIYYETISSFTPIFFKNFFKKKVSIFCHYHEYTSKDEYHNGMKLVKRLHKLEKNNFKKYYWISHTNVERISLFKKDNDSLKLPLSIFHVLPNYPPLSWINKEKSLNKSDGSKKLVYIGSLSIQNFYLTEIVSWVLSNKIYLDIYSHNISKDAYDYIKNLNSPYVQLKGSIQYFEIPETLKAYDIGIVLYRPVSANYIYNAPNKLFEYLACGLDVWIPQQMKYLIDNSLNAISSSIIPINFDELRLMDTSILHIKTNTQKISNNCFFENVYGNLCQSLQ